MNFSSPFYPWQWPERVDCSYIIDVGNGNNVLVKFVDMDLKMATLTLDEDVFRVLQFRPFEFPDFYISKNSTMMIGYQFSSIRRNLGKFLLSLTSVYLPGVIIS